MSGDLVTRDGGMQKHPQLPPRWLRWIVSPEIVNCSKCYTLNATWSWSNKKGLVENLIREYIQQDTCTSLKTITIVKCALPGFCERAALLTQRLKEVTQYCQQDWNNEHKVKRKFGSDHNKKQWNSFKQMTYTTKPSTRFAGVLALVDTANQKYPRPVATANSRNSTPPM